MNTNVMVKGFAAVMASLLLTTLAAAPCLASAASQLILESRSRQGITGTLTLAGSPLRTMTAVPMQLALVDQEGAPVRGAQVHCNLTMPAMAMPENRPAMTTAADGYVGEAIFTMAGAWRATFSLVLPSGEHDEIVFDIEQVLLQ